jgi:O-antigen/teichoic acid export membrane protein
MRSIYQVISFDLISKVLMGFIGIILIRYMVSSEYAVYTFTLSVVTVVAQTLSSTFRRIYIVGYDKFGLSKYKEAFLGLQFLLILFFALILLIYSRNFNTIYILTNIMIMGFTLIEFTKTIFQQELKFMKFSIIEINRSFSFFLFVLILIYFFRFRLSASQILAVQSLTMVLISVIVLWRKLDIKGIFKFKKAFQMGKGIIGGRYIFLLGYTLFATLLGNLDIFMLKLLSNSSELATYGSAFRYYSLLLLTLSSVNSVFLPVIQNINNRIELDQIYRKHAKMLVVFIPVVLLGAWLSYWIIPFIDMGKYPGAVTVFRTLSISAIFSFLFSPHTNFVMKFEDFKFLFYVILISVIMNIICNAFMIPLFGSKGAAISTLLTFGFSNFMTYHRARKFRIELPIS